MVVTTTALVSFTTPSLYSFLLSPSRRPLLTPKPGFLSLPSRTRIRNPLVPLSTASDSTSTAYNYSGWDDLALSEPDGLDPIQDLLIWIGIRNGKSGVVFLLGFLSALAVARVRLSPFTFLPVSVLVFLAGFAVGIAREGVGSGVEKIRVSDERSRVLRGIIGELDEKVEELRDGLQTIGVSSRMQGGKVRKSIDVVECLKIKLANAARVVEKDRDFGEIVEGDNRKLTSKLGQKRATFEAVASDVVRYFGSLIEENIGELGRKKKAENLNKDELPEEVNLKREESSKLNSLQNVMGNNRKSESDYSNGRSYNQEINDINSSRLERTVLKHIKNSSQKAGFIRESKKSSVVEQTVEIHNRSYKFKFEEIGERDSAEKNSETQYQTDINLDFDDDEEFNRNLKEASDILTTARECLKVHADEERAEALLYKASSLLTTAVSLKPSCLSAIGQLGNACLLHGELKLRMSRELRALLDDRGNDSRFRRAEVGSALVDACEECEKLLVEAGKNYRKALTIDANDAKALYNWGLALSFRAQLLSDIGPEASVDADKIYLAAIDKFDAMLSRNNAYAPEALYRWGMTLQQRSQLRQHNNKEKVRLLQQAKCLFEEVLFMEADNLTVRDALSSCISELQYHDLWL